MNNESLRIVLLGAAGRMGRMIIRCMQSTPGAHLSGAVDIPTCPERGKDAGVTAGVRELNVPIGDRLEAVLPDSDVVIDFSGHQATAEQAPRIAAAGKAWVIGTTGLSESEKSAVQTAAQSIPVVMAPNMSLGINLLFALVEQAARTLRDRGYDCEIIERHHRRKKDAPSGTALGLGEAVARGYQWNLKEVAVDGRGGMPGERPVQEIGFHAVRGGDLVGDHTVLFATDGECIELSHRATSREALAMGALRAALWVARRPNGLYSMRDVLGI